MLILFTILATIFGAVALTVLLSYAITWYESADADPALVPGRLGREQLTLTLRLLLRETCCLFATVLCHPLGWLPPRPVRFDPAGGPPVIFLHGLFQDRACWWWLRWRFQRRGLRNLYTLNLPPWKNLEVLTERLALLVDAVRRNGAGDRVHLVAHSMGGLIARNYLQLRGGARKVDRLVLIAVPNHGSKLAPFSVSNLGEQALPGSALLQRLNAADLPCPETITTIYSRHDNIILPWQSARLPGVRNCELAGIGHVGLLFSSRTLDLLTTALISPLPTEPGHDHS